MRLQCPAQTAFQSAQDPICKNNSVNSLRIFFGNKAVDYKHYNVELKRVTEDFFNALAFASEEKIAFFMSLCLDVHDEVLNKLSKHIKFLCVDYDFNFEHYFEELTHAHADFVYCYNKNSNLFEMLCFLEENDLSLNSIYFNYNLVNHLKDFLTSDVARDVREFNEDNDLKSFKDIQQAFKENCEYRKLFKFCAENYAIKLENDYDLDVVKYANTTKVNRNLSIYFNRDLERLNLKEIKEELEENIA